MSGQLVGRVGPRDQGSSLERLFSSKWANLIYTPAQVSLIPTHSQACWGERALDSSPLSLSRRDGEGLVTFSVPGPGYSVPFGAAV